MTYPTVRQDKGPWVGRWQDPWNRGPWDYCLWQIKWENVFLRRLSDLRNACGPWVTQ
jgi:hypothetical protein